LPVKREITKTLKVENEMAFVNSAVAEAVPHDPPLKPATDFKAVGKVIKHLDAPAKVKGTGKYGIDAVPGRYLLQWFET
tara:strand:- start:239 stop:475 length:237 start_codon:yes stop_codon:yes gene_type:complete